MGKMTENTERFCKFCGTQIIPGQKFCGGCGKPTGGESVRTINRPSFGADSMTNALSSAQRSATNVNMRPKAGFAIAVFFSFVGFAVAAGSGSEEAAGLGFFFFLLVVIFGYLSYGARNVNQRIFMGVLVMFVGVIIMIVVNTTGFIGTGNGLADAFCGGIICLSGGLLSIGK